VVEARKEDWSPDLDPFTFTERDGFFYGRGTTDDKAMAAIWIANLIRYKQEGLVPDRDLIVALTADEEGGDHNGVDWLLRNHRALIEADYCLNEGGGGDLKKGRRLANNVQAAEKVYLSFRLEVKNPGGHSSLPTKDNAIYHLAGGLARLAQYELSRPPERGDARVLRAHGGHRDRGDGDGHEGRSRSPRPIRTR